MSFSIEKFEGPLTVVKTIIRGKQAAKKNISKDGRQTLSQYAKPLGYIVTDGKTTVALEKDEATDAVSIHGGVNVKLQGKTTNKKDGSTDVTVYLVGTTMSLQDPGMIVLENYLQENNVPISEEFLKSSTKRVRNTSGKKTTEPKFTTEQLAELIRQRRAGKQGK